MKAIAAILLLTLAGCATASRPVPKLDVTQFDVSTFTWDVSTWDNTMDMTENGP